MVKGEGELEVKAEKVRMKEEVMDWLRGKEEKKDNLEIEEVCWSEHKRKSDG